MSEVLYEVLFDLDYQNGKLVGVPAASNTNTSWQTSVFTFDKNAKKMKKKDPHVVKFTIAGDNTGKDFRFPPVPQDAMWVEKGTTCPTSGENCDYESLEPIVVVDDGMTLIAINRNEKPGEKWAFTLNFVPRAGGSPEPWDPIGDNLNGGKPLTSVSLLTYAAIALGTGIVSALATVATLKFAGFLG